VREKMGDQNQGRRDERKQMTWVDCKDFKETLGTLDLVVRVSRSDEFVPKYSIKLGRLRPDNMVTMNIPIFARGQGKISIVRVGEALARLTKEAEDFVHNAVQYREDEVIDGRQEKERRGMKKDEQPKGLGALGKMDAAKRSAPVTASVAPPTLASPPPVTESSPVTESTESE
jgi:hypothetical protein